MSRCERAKVATALAEHVAQHGETLGDGTLGLDPEAERAAARAGRAAWAARAAARAEAEAAEEVEEAAWVAAAELAAIADLVRERWPAPPREVLEMLGGEG